MPISRRTGTTVLLFFSLFFCNVAAQAIDLTNDETFIYDIRENTGELNDGSWNDETLDDACDGCWELRIDGDRYEPPGMFTLDLSGREVTFPIETMSGLEVVRRVYVPQEVNFIRYLNVLTNPTGEDITVQVSYDTNLGSDSSTRVLASFDGDIVATTDDFWIVTGGDGGDPPVAHVWDGLGGIDRIDTLDVTAPGDDDVDFSWDDVTVPAGETVIYMTLGAMGSTGEDAVLKANALFNQQFGQITFNLDEATLLLIRNFAFIDTDEDGMPDGYEEVFGLDPNDPSDADSDNDMDGLTAIEEFNLFTSPIDSDSDDDSLLDGDEVNNFLTDPNDADTDGDEVSDPGELFSGLDPLDPSDAAVTKVISDGVSDARTPELFEDSAGNLHVVYSADLPGGGEEASRGGAQNPQVYYTLLDNMANVLIAPTQISDDVEDYNIRAQVAATDAGIVYVVWQQRCCGEQLYLKVLDITADDQDGSAADPAVIGPDPARLLTSDGVNHAAIGVDADGNAHIIGSERCGGSIRYYQVGPDGMDILPETTVADFDTCHATVDLGLDSGGNPHVVYSSDEDPDGNGLSAYQLFYAMLDASDGALLIAPTLLTADDGLRAKHSTISVDSSDFAHIVWGNGVASAAPERGGSGDLAEVFYTRLDPSLDDQDGSAAMASAITVTPMTMLTDDDGIQSWYVESRLSGGDIQITWNDGGGFGSAPVYHIALDPADGSTTTPILVSSSNQRLGGNNYVPVAGGKALIKLTGESVVEIVAKTLFAGPVPTATGTGIAAVDVAGGIAVSLEALNVADLPEDVPAAAPVLVDFPDGLFRIVVNGVAVGGSVDLTLDLPTEYEIDKDFVFKWNALTGWVPFDYTLGAAPNQIVLTLTDGGAGDADGLANGQIVDPVGPGVDANLTPPQFTSEPVLSVTEGEDYSYTAVATDAESANVVIGAQTVPAWMTFTDNGDGTATLTGTPDASDVGDNPVTLVADDLAFVSQQAVQSFAVTVNAAVAPPEPPVSTPVSGSGGGNGATTPWLLLLASGLLFLRIRRSKLGVRR